MADHKSLAAALAAFQAELPKLTKDETAKVKGETRDGRAYDRSYGYADLAQVCETVLPILGKHGLSVSSGTVFIGDNFMLEVTLQHESGEGERTAVWPLPTPGRGVGPQDIGSSMTYGRRYLTLALTGTYPGGEDDDGAKAQANSQRWDNARPRQEQEQQPAPVPEKTEWTDDEVREMHSNITKLEIAKAVNGYDWMASKNLHERKLPYPGGGELTATQVLAFRLADQVIQPDTDPQQIAACRAWAEARGLMKVGVSDDTTLGEELDLARDNAAKADAKAADEPVAAGRAAGDHP